MLPSPYTSFWLLVAAAWACLEFLRSLIIFLMLAAILQELRWKRPARLP